jgi:hypothetical protein
VSKTEGATGEGIKLSPAAPSIASSILGRDMLADSRTNREQTGVIPSKAGKDLEESLAVDSNSDVESVGPVLLLDEEVLKFIPVWQSDGGARGCSV